MTPKQTTWYWSEWGAVSRACKADGVPVPDRHELHKIALGREKSSKDFTNADFDAVLSLFWTYSKPASVNHQLRQQQQPRTRLIWKLTQELPSQLAVVLDHPHDQPITTRLAAAEQYIVRILEDKYHVPFSPDTLDTLSVPQLEGLVIDVTRAINQRRAKLCLTWPELRQAVQAMEDSLTHPSLEGTAPSVPTSLPAALPHFTGPAIHLPVAA